MNNDVSIKLKSFFNIIESLKDANIIWSDRYLGDIGEYLAAQKYNVVLSGDKRKEIIDGHIDEKTVQIKWSGSKTNTNINIGKLDMYDILILVLPKSSKHYPNNCKSDLVLYKIDSTKQLQSITKSNGKFYITKAKLKTFSYDELNYVDL